MSEPLNLAALRAATPPPVVPAPAAPNGEPFWKRKRSATAPAQRPEPPAVPPPTLPPAPGTPDPTGAFDWCRRAHLARHPCPAPGRNGRNKWLAAFALFCNEKGAPLADVLTWAESAPELAGHNTPAQPDRIRDTVTGIYHRDADRHASAPYTAPTAAAGPLAATGAPELAQPSGYVGPPTASTNGAGGFLPSLRAVTEKLRQKTEQNIEFAPALFWQDGEGVIWPRTVNLIQGQTGAHKSRVAELFSATMLARIGQNRAPLGDSLGLEFHPAEGEVYRICYVDTERNTADQFPFALQHIKRRGGYANDAHPVQLDYTSLLRVPRERRFDALREYLQDIRRGFAGHVVVVLDVLTDCLRDFNDPKDSLQLLDMINNCINDENVTFLAVIHENPGSFKARGHAGTEAANKASTVLQVGYVRRGNVPTDVIELRYLKRRYGKPGLAVFAQFDEETKGLVRAENDRLAEAIQSAQRKAPLAELMELLPELLTLPTAAGQLTRLLAEALGASERTVRERLGELLPDGAAYVENADGQLCRLVKRQQGREAVYSLEPVPLPE